MCKWTDEKNSVTEVKERGGMGEKKRPSMIGTFHRLLRLMTIYFKFAEHYSLILVIVPARRHIHCIYVRACVDLISYCS